MCTSILGVILVAHFGCGVLNTLVVNICTPLKPGNRQAHLAFWVVICQPRHIQYDHQNFILCRVFVFSCAYLLYFLPTNATSTQFSTENVPCNVEYCAGYMNYGLLLHRMKTKNN